MKKKITPEKYSSILTSIELDNISLSNASIKVFELAPNGGNIDLDFKDKYSFSCSENKVCFVASFKLEGNIKRSENEVHKLFSVSGEYNIKYNKANDIEVTTDFFDVFRDISLPVIIWPYFREYIQNMVVRAGLPPFTLPARIYKTSNEQSKTSSSK